MNHISNDTLPPSPPTAVGVGGRLLVATTHTHTHFIFASGLSSSFGTEKKKRQVKDGQGGMWLLFLRDVSFK